MTLLDQLREAMETEIETGLSYRRAKGSAFLDCQSEGLNVTTCWQRIATDPAIQKLERDYLYAKAERQLLWLEANGRPDGDGDEEGADE